MVDGFFRQVKDAILGQESDAESDREVRPASEDPYGDPGEVRPASEDPYGDPGESGAYGDVRPASEDPYGDPADGDYRA